MNLIPMIVAAVFSLVLSEVKSLGEFFKRSFFKRKSPILDSSFLHPCHLLWDFHPAYERSLYWELPLRPSSLFPLDILYGGLEEVGWRWFLQDHLSFSKYFISKMMVLSLVWFLWHIPIYQLPWITAGSSNYLIFYLMILGNSLPI